VPVPAVLFLLVAEAGPDVTRKASQQNTTWLATDRTIVISGYMEISPLSEGRYLKYMLVVT
jgi:hypothetical protein